MPHDIDYDRHQAALRNRANRASIAEAAEILECPVATVANAVALGHVPSTYHGRYVDLADVEVYLQLRRGNLSALLSAPATPPPRPARVSRIAKISLL